MGWVIDRYFTPIAQQITPLHSFTPSIRSTRKTTTLPPQKHIYLPKTRCPHTSDRLFTRMIHFWPTSSCVFSRNATEFGRAYAWRAFIHLSTFHSSLQFVAPNTWDSIKVCSRKNQQQVLLCALLAVFRVFTAAAADRYCEYSQYYCCVVFRGSVLLPY